VFSGEQGRPSRVVTAFADITERKRVEERLRDSEERHRRLFESIDQGFCTIEVLFDDNTPVDYRFLMVNPAFARQTGIFEATGRRMRDISPTHEEEWYQRFGQVAVTGESMRVEGLYSPRQRYFEVLAWKIGDPVERTIAVLFNDITGRREEQELMRRSEERWNAALEQLVEGVVIATQSGDVIYRNSATRRIYGFASADEGVGPLKEAARKFQLWTLDGGRPLTLDEWPIARIVRGETVRDVELRVRRTDEDRERVVSYSGAMSDTVGGERLIYLSVYDLTDQRKAEEAARRSAQQLQDVINGSPGLIFIKDLDGRYITINATYERFLGLRTDEVRGKTVYDLFPRDQAELLRENDRRVAETGAPLQAEESFDLPDGTHVFLSNKFPLHDTGGNVYAVCGISTDITERKKSDERLRQLQKLDSIGVLAGGIAHDFNNLLTGVIGNASLIQETLAADHAAAPLVHRIIQTGEQLAHLTRQLLAYAGKGRFVLEPLDVSALAREMTELLRLSIPNEVTLHFDLATDLPAIKADRGQAQQILMNLVINAGEAIGDHDGLVTVRTQLRTVDDGFVRTHPEAAGLSPGKYVVLQVRDTGCGMDTAVKAKLFDPFFSTKFTGRGLGLAAVSGIVRGHGGAIIVSSHPGKGSIFDVLLPAMVLPATTQPEAAPVVADRGVVFVIDDELIVRQLARMALERKGYAVLEADEGLTALGIFKQYLGTIDLVILDLSMPGMSGEEILPELRKIRPDVKVLISSGYGDSNAMTVFQGQQVSGFLQKPYTVAGLAEMVKRALS
jgi:PAS domain S-box-containing protein